MCVSSRELVVSPSSGPGLGQGWGRCLEIMPSLSEPGWGNSLVVQWLELRVFTAEGAGTIPGWETKIWQTMQQNWEERDGTEPGLSEKGQTRRQVDTSGLSHCSFFPTVDLRQPYLSVSVWAQRKQTLR